MKRLLGILLPMLLATAASGADVSGKWTGSLVLNDGNRDAAYVQLKQTGGAITGSQGPSAEKQFPITNGRIEGDQVIIEARPGSATLKLTMKLEGTRLTGDVFEDDQKIGTVSLEKIQ